MKRRVLILDGHPDPATARLIHALADAYREGAAAGEHDVQVIRLADLEFPLLRSQNDYERGEPCKGIRKCQAAVDWASHVVILYPLWLGSMPALLKGLLEQILRPGFAFSTRKLGRWPVKLQSGKSARIIVTMGMPALVYRWFYLAHSVRALQRNILRFVGFRRVRATFIGGVGTLTPAERSQWLAQVRSLGQRAA